MLELEPHKADARPTNPEAATVLIDLHKAFGKVQLVVVWN